MKDFITLSIGKNLEFNDYRNLILESEEKVQKDFEFLHNIYLWILIYSFYLVSRTQIMKFPVQCNNINMSKNYQKFNESSTN